MLKKLLKNAYKTMDIKSSNNLEILNKYLYILTKIKGSYTEFAN